MGIFKKLFTRSTKEAPAPSGKSMVAYVGKIDLARLPNLDQRIQLTKRIHGKFFEAYKHLIDPAFEPVFQVAKDGAVTMNYMLLTTDYDTHMRAGRALYALWGPWTVE